MRFRLLCALFVGLALTSLSLPGTALTVPFGLPKSGMSQGAICPSGSSSCFGSSPEFALTGVGVYGLVNGSLQYNPGTNPTVDITMGLQTSARFVGSGAGLNEVDIVAGTAFDASGIPVTQTPLGGGGFQLVQTGNATGTVNGTYAQEPTGSGSTLFSVSPAVSGLTCTLFTGTDQCSFTYGVSGFTIALGSSGAPYDVLATFTVYPVIPEPGTLVLFGAGVVGLAVAGTRRSRGELHSAALRTATAGMS
jgi:hypothetical protein